MVERQFYLRTAMGRALWLFAGILGLLLPYVWLGGTVFLYSYVPAFRGSSTVFTFVVCIGAMLLASVALTAATNWRLRVLLLAVTELLLAVQVAGLLAWAYLSMGFGTTQQRVEATAAWMEPLGCAWGSQSPGELYSIASTSLVKRDGIDSLRFELREGEVYSDLFGKTSFRSEVNTRDFAPLGDVRWYSLSILLPANFPIEDNRLVLAQWHGADKKYLGEPSRSPVLAFRFSRGHFFVTIRHSSDRVVCDPSSATSVTLFDTDRFPLAVWNDFVVQARWSYGNDGQVNVWWNGRQVVQYSGPVGYNDDLGPYFKFGLYRDNSEQTYVAYFNHVKSGICREDVEFADGISGTHVHSVFTAERR